MKKQHQAHADGGNMETKLFDTAYGWENEYTFTLERWHRSEEAVVKVTVHWDVNDYFDSSADAVLLGEDLRETDLKVTAFPSQWWQAEESFRAPINLLPPFIEQVADDLLERFCKVLGDFDS